MARRTVRVYVLALIPLLVGLLVLLALVAPRMVATLWDALGLQTDRLSAAAGDGQVLADTVAVVQSISLALPLLGLVLSISRLGRRGAAGLVGWARASAWRAGVGLAGSLAVAGGLLALWWPNGEYEPLRPGERGTVRDAVRAASSIPTGRPSFTPERADRYRDVPTVREREAAESRAETSQPRREDTEEGSATPMSPAVTSTSTTPTTSTVPPAQTVPADPAGPADPAVPAVPAEPMEPVEPAPIEPPPAPTPTVPAE